MPVKTAERKLIFPAVCIILALSALALLPALEGGSRQFAIDRGGEVFLPLVEGFAAVSHGGMSVYSLEGEKLFGEERAFAPSLCRSDGERIIVSSENEVRLYDDSGFIGCLEGSGEVLSLAICGDYSAVSREDSWYKSAVTFYEGTEKLFTRCLAKGECTDILLADSFACLLTENEMHILRSAEEVTTVPVTEAVAIHPSGSGICLQRRNSLEFYSPDGEKRGSFEESFTLVRSFGGTVCAVTEDGTAALDSSGKIKGRYPARPIKFGAGDSPVLIMGEEIFIFDEKMEFKYSIENKYIPLNVITDKNAAALFWQRAAQVYRK